MSAAPGVAPSLATASSLATSSPAAPPGASAPAEAPTIANDASDSGQRSTSEGDGGASSRGRRRLTASIGSLLSGKKDKHRIEEHAASSASASSVALEGADAQRDAAAGSWVARSRRSSSASRRPGLGGSAIAESFPTPSVAPAPDRSHKPPVALPHIFRRRHSGSRASPAPSSSSPSPSPALAASTSSPTAVDASRSSFDAGSELRHVPLDGVQLLQPAASDSNGSLAAWTVTGSSTSTAPTSPDALASAPEDDGATTTTAEKRRRSSLALAHELGGDGRNEVAEGVFLVGCRRSWTSLTLHVRRPRRLCFGLERDPCLTDFLECVNFSFRLHASLIASLQLGPSPGVGPQTLPPPPLLRPRASPLPPYKRRPPAPLLRLFTLVT